MTRSDRLVRVPWAAVAAFVVLSFGLAWGVSLPLWLTGGPQSPLLGAWLPVLGAVMMFTPRGTSSNDLVVVQLSTQSGAITETNATVVAKRGSSVYTGPLSYLDWIALG